MKNMFNHNLKEDIKIKQIWNLFEEICAKSPSDSTVKLTVFDKSYQFEAHLEIKAFRYQVDQKVCENSFQNLSIEIRRSFLTSLKNWKKSGG